MSDKSAQVIKEFLQLHCMTISDFSRFTGMSRYTIHKYLKGGNVHPVAASKMEENLLANKRIFFPREKLID